MHGSFLLVVTLVCFAVLIFFVATPYGQSRLLAHPFLATIVSAFWLSILWTSAWLLVLIALSFQLEITTDAPTLVGGLLLSTAAEALVRSFETSGMADKFSRGQLDPTESEVGLWKAFCICLIGVVVVGLFGNSIAFSDDFSLPYDPNLFTMTKLWMLQFADTPEIAWSVTFCVVVRVFIYKQAHNTKQWRDTADYQRKVNRGDVLL